MVNIETIGLYVKKSIILTICAYYSIKSIIQILILFITKYDTKFWKVRERTISPKCLLNKDLGEHKYIQVNGIKIHYVENGDPNKPLMLFVHGFPEFWYSWRYQIKEFSKDYWTIAIDMRGYGDSEKPKGVLAYNIDNLTHDIKQIVSALGREKFTLVAHDWGGVVAWNYITKHMDTIEKYVIIAAPPQSVWAKSILSSWNQFRKSWYVFFFQAPYLPEFIFRMFDLESLKVIGEGKFSTTFTIEDLEAYKYTYGRSDSLTYPINYYRCLTRDNRPRKLPGKLDYYAPGLFLIGEHDKYISKDAGKATEKLYNNLKYREIPEATHFAQQDKPESTNKIIREFLAEKK